MAKDDIGGVWRTIGGRRVFIKDGQSLESAMKESGKFSNSKSSKKRVDNTNNEDEHFDPREQVKYHLEKGDLKKAKSLISEYGLEDETDEFIEGMRTSGGRQEAREFFNKNESKFGESQFKPEKQEVYEERKQKGGYSRGEEKQADGSINMNMDEMKKAYAERQAAYDKKIAQFAADREKMTNSDWEASIMAYEHSGDNTKYKTMQDIMDDVEAYQKNNPKAPTEKKIAYNNATNKYEGYNYEELSSKVKSLQMQIDDVRTSDPAKARELRKDMFDAQKEMTKAPFGYGKQSKRAAEESFWQKYQEGKIDYDEYMKKIGYKK